VFIAGQSLRPFLSPNADRKSAHQKELTPMSNGYTEISKYHNDAVSRGVVPDHKVDGYDRHRFDRLRPPCSTRALRRYLKFKMHATNWGL
jgi:hypothetical protein